MIGAILCGFWPHLLLKMEITVDLRFKEFTACRSVYKLDDVLMLLFLLLQVLVDLSLLCEAVEDLAFRGGLCLEIDEPCVNCWNSTHCWLTNLLLVTAPDSALYFMNHLLANL